MVEDGAVPAAMGWLDFFASVVGSLAWPVAAIIIAFGFRTQIKDLIAKIRTLKWGDAAVDFADKLDKAETEAATLAEATENLPAPPLAPSGRFHELLAISPNAAILDTWAEIENQIRVLGKHHGLLESQARPSRLGDELVKTGVLPINVHKMLFEMRTMRNAAAHGAQTTPEDALRFYQLSQRTLAVVQNLL